MGPHEPHWHTNSSFSPPPFDFRFQGEALSFGSNEGNQLYGSSASSISRESRSWLRGNQLATHQYVVSDAAGTSYSNPSDISSVRQWTPPALQEINVDDYDNFGRDAALRSLSFSPAMEGTSVGLDSAGSVSSRSDSTDYESVAKSHPSHRNFSSRRCFMSKPIHPLSFPSEMPRRESVNSMPTALAELDASTSQIEKHLLSSASGSLDLTDVSDQFESEVSYKSYNISDCSRCGLCERFLSQRSPWSTRRIVRSGDMPVSGVLSCCHVFHAECLEQITPKARRNDPPCPICSKVEEGSSPDQRMFAKFFPRLKHFGEDGPSKPWGCVQAGDCVQGALQGPSRNAMVSLNWNRMRKNLSLKDGKPTKEFPGKLRKTSTFASPLYIGSADHPTVGSSMSLSSNLK
ncbi:hypothetical protein LIER_28693 [Lithospermum erythrorhizon]|uniref:RING-type domain-containing protein n=1 Tax=Lithospermum erythrorhizon TaxID=34254 RepID=A0AAV3RH11_LITER